MNHSGNDEFLKRLEQVEEKVQNLSSLGMIGSLSSNNSIDKKISTLEASIKDIKNKDQEVIRLLNSRPSSTSDQEESTQNEISKIRREIEELSSSLQQKVNHTEIEDTVRQFSGNQDKIRQIEDGLHILQKDQIKFSPEEINGIQNISVIREEIKQLSQLVKRENHGQVNQIIAKSIANSFLSRILLITIMANLVGLGLGLHFFIRIQEQYRNYAVLEMESYNLNLNARLVSLEKQLDSFPNQAELQPELDILRENIEQLKTQYQGLSSQDSNLQTKIQALEEQVQALETSRTTTHENNDNLLW